MKLITASAVLFVAGGLALACSSPTSSAPPAQVLWGGDLKPVVSVKELMRDVIDPLSDYVFLAVGSEITAKGHDSSTRRQLAAEGPAAGPHTPRMIGRCPAETGGGLRTRGVQS